MARPRRALMDGWTYPMVADVFFVLKKVLVACRRCRDSEERCLPDYKACLWVCRRQEESERFLRQMRTLKENLALSWWGLLGKSEGRRLHRI
jgi:hypothetical protein